MGKLAKRDAGWPAELGYARLWYEPLMEQAYEDAQIRIADIVQLEQIAGGYSSRERFLTELTLDPPDATSDQSGVPTLDEDYLILSTIHSAKGQEWKAVHVLNVVDGCIPSDLGTGSTHELDEERRLLYVAMTRARDELNLIVPQRFFVTQQARNGDRHMYAQRTRFIPRAMVPLFEDVLWPPVKPAHIEGLSPAPARMDIGAQMRGMWSR
jgi:DNA helicase-2/ATP-dependent DNA helicase PcrA